MTTLLGVAVIPLNGTALCHRDSLKERHSTLSPFNHIPQSAPGQDADLLAGHLGTFKHFTINPPGNSRLSCAVLCNARVNTHFMLGYHLVQHQNHTLQLLSFPCRFLYPSIDQALCARKVCRVPTTYTASSANFPVLHENILDCRRTMALADQCQRS